MEYICYIETLECIKWRDLRWLWEGLIYLMDSSGAKEIAELQIERP